VGRRSRPRRRPRTFETGTIRGWDHVRDRDDIRGWDDVRDRDDVRGWDDVRDRDDIRGWDDVRDRDDVRGWDDVRDRDRRGQDVRDTGASSTKLVLESCDGSSVLNCSVFERGYLQLEVSNDRLVVAQSLNCLTLELAEPFTELLRLGVFACLKRFVDCWH
jgi:hypothetical protein